MIRAGVLFLLLLVLPARAEPVDLQLILAVDASESVSGERFELQMHGYAAAFRDPAVLDAIGKGARGRIAIAMEQWTGPKMHAPVFDWMEVHDAASAAALAAAIDAAPRHLNWGGTSISGAVLYALERFEGSPMPGARRVIDISGDGANNSGRPIAEVRDEAVAAGVTINGLPILWVEPGLAEHYRDEVIGGDGAFMIAIDDYEGFAEAIQRKLVSEIAGVMPSRFATSHWRSDWVACSAARCNARPRCRQDAVHGGDADPQLCCDRVACLARLCQSKDVGCLGASGRRTALIFALGGSLCDALALPLQHQVALEGRDGAQHGQHQLPGRAPCVDPLATHRKDDQGDTALFQVFHDVQ